MDNIAIDVETPENTRHAPDEKLPDSGLVALTAIAGYYRISARADTLAREYALKGSAGREDILRAAGSIGLKSRIVDARADQGSRAQIIDALQSQQEAETALVNADRSACSRPSGAQRRRQ